jgi:acetoin utilization deacetylase AcuC-like enzyme
MSPEEGVEYVDPDTVMSPGSLEAALRAVGAATAAVDAVFTGQADNAFCAHRPPGHHAESRKPMGFCLFNQVAMLNTMPGPLWWVRVPWLILMSTTATVTKKFSGRNPTRSMAPPTRCRFPGSGASNETGVGNIFNAPLRAGDGGAQFREAMRSIILPALDDFAPDLVLISAGFDAHHADPLGSLRLNEEDFAWATLELMSAADAHAEGRVVSVLEGGYDLQGLAASVAIHVQALMRGSDGLDQDDDEDDET